MVKSPQHKLLFAQWVTYTSVFIWMPTTKLSLLDSDTSIASFELYRAVFSAWMLLTNLSSQFLSVHLQDSSHHYHKDERIKCYMSPEKVFWNGWQIYRLSLKPEKFQIRHLSSLRRLRVTGFITAKACLPFGEPSRHHPRARPRGHPLSRFWVWGWALDVPFTESQNQLGWRKPLRLSWGMIKPHVNCKTSDIIMGYDWTSHVNYNIALSTSSVLHPVCP